MNTPWQRALALVVVPLVLAAVATLWPFVVGEPGFYVEARDPQGTLLYARTVRYLIVPDELAPVPPGGSLTAAATLYTRSAGVHQFSVASTATVRFQIDAQAPYLPRRGQRPSPYYARLERGAHTVQLKLTDADVHGGLVLGLRAPSLFARAGAPPGPSFGLSLDRWPRPLGPGRVFARPSFLPAGVVAWLEALPLLVFFAALLALTAWLMRQSGQTPLRFLAALFADARSEKILAAGLILYLASPFLEALAEPGYFACHEEESYIVRLQQFDAAIRGGVPMGRWWSDPVHGRGIPMLCFYAPLFYLLALPLLLLRANPVLVVRLLSALPIVVGALSTYVLCRRRVSLPAALFGVALFVAAPYLHNDIYIRADLAEALAFGCFPLVLVALDGLLERPDRTRVGIAALSLGLLGMSHNITAYFSLFFIATWLGVQRLLGRRIPVGAVLLSGALGAALVIFYAVPALVERKWVSLDLMQSGYYSFFKHYVRFPHWIWRDMPAGPYEMRNYFGVASCLAVAACLVALLQRRRADATHWLRQPAVALGLCGLCGCAVALFLIMPSGGIIYRWVPLARFVTFPWRILLFGSCFIPFCGAAAVELWFARRRPWAAALGVFLVVGSAAVVTGSPERLLRTHLRVEEFLRSLSVNYVTSMNEYLPRAATDTLPPFDDIARLDPPAAGRFTARERFAGRYRVHVYLSRPANVEFNAHWFPGWQARRDGQRVAIGPQGEAKLVRGGLIRVPIAAGVHAVELFFARTWLRWLCDLLSLAALIAICGLLFWRPRNRQTVLR